MQIVIVVDKVSLRKAYLYHEPDTDDPGDETLAKYAQWLLEDAIDQILEAHNDY